MTLAAVVLTRKLTASGVAAFSLVLLSDAEY